MSRWILGSILIVCVTAFGYLYLRELEVTKVTLKCTEKLLMMKDAPIEVSYYKITKHLLDDEPLNLYVSNPNTDSKDFSPWISGIGEKSSKSKGITFDKKYYYPEYYSFVTDTTKNTKENSTNNLPQIEIVTYINRNKLSIESTFIGDKKIWSEGQCEVVDKDEFTRDWESKKSNIKNKMRI
jgi:hypothetical protein